MDVCPNPQDRVCRGCGASNSDPESQVHADVSPLRGSTSHCGQRLQGSVQDPSSRQKTTRESTQGAAEAALELQHQELRRRVRTCFPFKLPLSKPGAVSGPSIPPAEPVPEPIPGAELPDRVVAVRVRGV
ncbi:hypothetical protein MTO96_042304 [Rhipicephalus appendiculatus]